MEMAEAARDITAPLVHTQTATRDRVAVGVFTATSFVGSTLLFLVQPMVGRLLLPRAGGSASLWSTAMVFFQVTLLAGYLFAHFSTSRLGVARHRYAHLAVLAAPLLVLPLAVPEGWSLNAAQPVLDTLRVLTVMVGLPFFALATASPTLQRWFAETGHRQASDPYFLYAAGNVGSIGALAGYPLLIEPHLGLGAQTRVFTLGYAALVALTAGCALLVRSHSGHRMVAVASGSRLAPRRRLTWVVLAAVPSALLLGVTRHLATDVASFPLLWAVPLALYLLTFVIAFRAGSERRVDTVNMLVLIGAIGLPLSFLGLGLTMTVGIHLAWFFAAALLCHLRLAADRPPVEHLTEFYAWLSVGGALGGVTVALLAPVIFDRVWEYPLAIVAAVALGVPMRRLGGARRHVRTAATTLAVLILLAAGAWFRADDDFRMTAAALGAAGAIVYLVWGRPRIMAPLTAATLLIVVAVGPTQAIHRDRSFFGTYEIIAYPDRTELVMGTTIHGRELADNPGHASSYYHPAGPLGAAFERPDDEPPWHIGVVGLGVGEIAAYGRPGDQITFFEIDPLVADLATNTAWFGHLDRSAAEVDIQVGDGRLLVEASDDRYDVLVVDAFSSDAIPVHLLTTEAIEAYLDHVGDGVVMVHISNRYFDLGPVLARIATHVGADAQLWHYDPLPADRATGASSSRWVSLRATGAPSRLDGPWESIEPEGRRWTDDFSDLLATLDL